MAFWLERILSSKSLVCNRMQTGPISSLPASWQLSKRLRSRPHNCVQFQECHWASRTHLLASAESGAVPHSEHGFTQSRNVDQSSETRSGYGWILTRQLLFLSPWEYPHFYSLAFPDCNPEGISLTQVGKHVAPARSLWRRPSHHNGRAAGFELGKGKPV